MLLSDLCNKTIAVWGMGTEGAAIKAYLEKHQIPSRIMVYNDADGAEAFQAVLDQAEVIVRSPGVSIYKPELACAKAKGISITSGSDLFLNEMRSRHPQTKVIGVSGSKGKSMSVSILYHILLNAGCKVALGGNIGKALVDLLDEEYEYVVGEFSSYQASDLTTSPHIVMFTNLFSVHTDWHGGHERYCRDKLHLAAHQQPGDICFVNDRTPQLKEYAANLPNLAYYNIATGFHAEGREFYEGNQRLLTMDDLQIYGNHNLDNLAGVMSVVKHLGLDLTQAVEACKTVQPLPHRLQKVGTVDGVLFINDSISTAPEAAIGAMGSFDNKMAIISGGIENQQDYTDYARFIQNNPHIKTAITLFQCGKQIADALRQYVTREDFKLIEAENLSDAVNQAYREMKAAGGTLVLFSPTAPSFGYYKNFIERGEDFIKNVYNLKGTFDE